MNFLSRQLYLQQQNKNFAKILSVLLYFILLFVLVIEAHFQVPEDNAEE